MILNRFFPAGGRRSQFAAWGAALLALIHLCWLQLRPESELHRIYAFATRSSGSRAAIMQYEQLDQVATHAGSDNVLLKLAGHAKTNPVVENTLSFIYFRSSYALYPRRMYVGPDDQVVNNGRDIMRIGFNPGQQWLQEHDVRAALTFGNENADGESLRLEILSPHAEEPGISTGKSGGN
jgi:hypothetical protein